MGSRPKGEVGRRSALMVLQIASIGTQKLLPS
jgi:hypothetical protein